jgi:glycosyltransferase involved in cell wall biosynthesis
MKISIFFDIYCPFHETKDPGQIALGLLEIGTSARVIAVSKKELENYHPNFTLTRRTLSEFYDQQFWLKEDSDVVIAYPLQGKSYLPLIEKMKSGGKKVFLKLDSDGRIAYPLQRHYLRVPLRERWSVRDVIGDTWWHLPFESLKRRRHAEVALEAIRQVELSDGVIIESPEALSNLNFFLAAWGRQDLISKTHFIPNPVSPEFVEGEIGKKENIAVAYGRWDDFRQKNTVVMVETAVEFLKERHDYKFVIFGTGTDMVENLLGEIPKEVRERIEILGFVERNKIKGLLAGAKVFFVPSRWESFSISSGEALCSGCSIVGTPVESLRYLSMQGFSGSIAATFDREAILAALLHDAVKWDNGDYDPETIGKFWRAKLDRKTIAKSIQNMADAQVKVM